MNAETRNVNSLFSGTQTYRVRLYQRHYIWDESDWKKLWEDIKEKSDLRLRDENSRKEHSTGIIIIQPDGDNLELLDGQQRLITFQIILCAIRDIWMVLDNTEAAEGVHRLIENKGFDESESTGQYKLLPREGSNQERFLSIVEKKMVLNSEEDSDKGDGRIQEAYWYFRSAIAKFVSTNSDKLNNLYHTIIDNFTVDQIEVASGDEGARIFESIRRDKELGAFDLVRNHLFLRVATGKVRDELYRKYRCHFQFTDGLYDTYRRQLVNREDRLSNKDAANIFLAHFLKAKGENIESNAILEPTPRQLDNRLYDAYQTYRRELSETLNLDESSLQFVEHEFNELSKYAQVYEEIHDSDSEIGCRLEIHNYYGRVGGFSGYVSRRFINGLRQFILYTKNELRVSDSLLTSVFNLMESPIVRFVICTGKRVDIPEDPEPDSYEDRLLWAILGGEQFGFDDPSIFSGLENCLLINVLDINMRHNNLSSPELPAKFREFEIFPPQVVEKALRDYCQNQVPREPGEYTDEDSYLYAREDWANLICHILYEIELMIAKEKGITEADFDSMLEYDSLGTRTAAKRLLEHYPENIGNLTVCPSLWDVNDEWEVKEIVEREEKLIEYFNKRWPSIEDCLNKMIQSAKCELIGTDDGIKELSQIVAHDTYIEGIDRSDNQRVVLDKNSILFTCAAAAWHRLKPYIQEDRTLKGQALQPIQLSDGILRRNHEVVAVTCSGHRLRGEIEDFNEDAIDITINEEGVIVFKRGLYEFETMEQFDVQISNFIQDPQDQHHGILKVSEGPEDDYERFTKLFGDEPRRIHVHISECPNKDFHSLQPGQRIAFNIAQTEKGLYARNISLRGVFYELIQVEERNLIQTYEGTRELSQIVVHDTHIEGVDCNDSQRVALDKSSILFICPATDWSTLKPYIQEDAAVKERALGPIQSSVEKFQVNNWILEFARLGYPDVVAVARSGHVLRGEVKCFDEDLICMEISWKWVDINVIIFQQNLHEFEMIGRLGFQINNFIQDPQSEDYGIIEFSREGLMHRRVYRRMEISLDELPKEIHVHISQVPNEDFHLLQPGQGIAFNIAQTEKGLYARNISLLDPEEVARSRRRLRRRRDSRRRRR